ncbi:hypothetical protein HY483_00970 [Candidatus Woesearchaeota archaeon]|nr:hypothetical protein [Candidatus Woesearchaeota archaeon]
MIDKDVAVLKHAYILQKTIFLVPQLASTLIDIQSHQLEMMEEVKRE